MFQRPQLFGKTSKVDLNFHVKVCKLPSRRLEKQSSKSAKKDISEQIGTPWSRIHPGKLISPQTVKKFPTFYETQRFITAPRRVPIFSKTNPVNVDSIPLLSDPSSHYHPIYA
jgi:hypothetical protein